MLKKKKSKEKAQPRYIVQDIVQNNPIDADAKDNEIGRSIMRTVTEARRVGERRNRMLLCAESAFERRQSSDGLSD